MSGQTPRIRLTITGGGTGGHVHPALAVVDELRRRNQLGEVVWIGSRGGHEQQAALAAGIRFVAIPTGKLRRYLSLRNVTDAARVPLGIFAARRALRAARPDVVFSTGGFVSVPAVIAARGIAPVLTHEQTATLGLATRINARFATVLAISHQQTAPEARKIHRWVEVTGNPIRTELNAGDRARGLARLGFEETLPVVYVTGGARGASAINERVAALMPGILDEVQILHQTGPASANADAQRLQALRDSLDERHRRRYAIVEFIREELADVYATADLVVGRAGAGTVAELAYVGKPAIFIPLPVASGDEQAVNARVLENVGAAVVLPQPEATPERLRREMLAILQDQDRLKRMAAAARTVAQPDAAARIADLLTTLATDTSATTRR